MKPLLSLLGLALAASSLAQPKPDPLAPLDPKAPVPPARVQRLLPEPPPPRPPREWRAANEEVARIGGWRVYAREPAASEAKP